MFQLIKHVLQDPSDTLEMYLLFANQVSKTKKKAFYIMFYLLKK